MVSSGTSVMSPTKSLFSESLATYAPRYGGFCAYAVSKGSFAPADPHAWVIHNDKLYLNYSKSARDLWKRDIDGNISRADKNWIQLESQR